MLITFAFGETQTIKENQITDPVRAWWQLLFRRVQMPKREVGGIYE